MKGQKSYPRKHMSANGATTINQAVIELTQSGVNTMFSGPTGSIGDNIDGLGLKLRAVISDGVICVNSEGKCSWRVVGF
jgi:hypothetical protein